MQFINCNSLILSRILQENNERIPPWRQPARTNVKNDNAVSAYDKINCVLFLKQAVLLSSKLKVKN